MDIFATECIYHYNIHYDGITDLIQQLLHFAYFYDFRNAIYNRHCPFWCLTLCLQFKSGAIHIQDILFYKYLHVKYNLSLSV